MNRPKVSILIPTYNQEKWVGQAVESALAQDYPDLEVVVSDDASTDRTPEALAGFRDERLRVRRNEKNLGRVANYRHALYNLASGKWVVNLDGDDYYTDPAFISRAVDAAGPGVVLVGAGVAVPLPGRTVRQVPCSRPEAMDGFDLFLAWEDKAVPHMAALYHRQTAMEAGFYTRDILSSDWESMLRLLLRGRAALLPLVAGVWRQHEGNISKLPKFDDFLANLDAYRLPAAEAVRLGRDPAVVRQWERRMVSARAMWFVTENALQLGHPERGPEAARNIEAFKRAVRAGEVAFAQPAHVLSWSVFTLLGPAAFAKLFKAKARLHDFRARTAQGRT